ncbi:hypothetical protein K491DRAFT_201562 [Lophiostoma macrostomum CBS 122681]|uniref:Uncharacterized protein n=1 Tax=Lophiostoma macrostomum CBS 122681 TaxID=1314788 RepID=A0A6A6SPB3_9PLEO|nr:hypothetical protein K491DRAFT_201562 [Lophiostoma macrostomum CBS 122681]
MSPACRRDLFLRPSRSASRPPQHFTKYTWQFLLRRPSCGLASILQHREGGEQPPDPGVATHTSAAAGKFSRWPAFWQYCSLAGTSLGSLLSCVGYEMLERQ